MKKCPRKEALLWNKRNKTFRIGAAFIEYDLEEDFHYVLYHTEVPEAHRGQGKGQQLAVKVIEKLIKDERTKFITLECDFLKAVYNKGHLIKRHPKIICEK